MVQAILGAYEHHIDDVTVIPSKGGVFEVIVGGQLVFSKKQLERHATIEEVLGSVGAIVNPGQDHGPS